MYACLSASVHCAGSLLFVLAGATAVELIASSEVIFTFLGAWLRLDEGSNLIQIIGTAIVLVGIILTRTAASIRSLTRALRYSGLSR
jgi:drug/metabolite transporter (DMT)-like permease